MTKTQAASERLDEEGETGIDEHGNLLVYGVAGPESDRGTFSPRRLLDGDFEVIAKADSQRRTDAILHRVRHGEDHWVP